MDILLSRQPVFDAAENVVGYRLAHDAAPERGATRGADASHHLLVDAFLGIGIDRLTAGRPAFITASAGLLRSGTIELLDTASVYLEINGRDALDDSLFDALQALHAAGYRIVAEAEALRHAGARLLEVCAAVRFDFAELPADIVERLAGGLVERGIMLVAENVSNRAERDRLAALGFDAFIGFEFSRPEVVSNRDLGVHQLRTLQLLRQIRSVDITDSEVAEAFRADVSLSYKLLRMVNSASIGGRGLQSIEHAIRLLGREALYRWLLLLFLSSGPRGGANTEVIQTALLRARLCETIANVAGRADERATLYTIGLISLIDILLGQPITQVIENMGFAPEVRDALLDRTGFHGAVLRMVEAYDLGFWDEFNSACEEIGISAEKVASLYLEALVWAAERAPEPQAA